VVRAIIDIVVCWNAASNCCCYTNAFRFKNGGSCLQPQEITRAGRLFGSSDYGGKRRVPLSVLAVLAGVKSRDPVRVRNGRH
jgi:hypothetical protein